MLGNYYLYLCHQKIKTLRKTQIYKQKTKAPIQRDLELLFVPFHIDLFHPAHLFLVSVLKSQTRE